MIASHTTAMKDKGPALECQLHRAGRSKRAAAVRVARRSFVAAAS